MTEPAGSDTEREWLEGKRIWSLDDFPAMGWHDAQIYAFTPPNDGMTVDFFLDYIFEWVKNDSGSGWKGWVVAPCRLRFPFVVNLDMQLQFGNVAGLYIEDLRIVGHAPWPNGEGQSYRFRLDLSAGRIEFESAGYEQTVLKAPQLIEGQSFHRWTGGPLFGDK